MVGTRFAIALAASGCCFGQAPAPAPAPVATAPAPAPVPVPAPTVPALPQVVAPPTPSVAGPLLPRVGDDPILPVAGLAPPALEGPTWQEIEIEWDAIRDLLASATPMSRGTRRGYRPIAAPREIDERFAERGLEARGAPAWWRPTEGVVILAVPYFLPGRNGGQSVAFFGPAEGGVRYVAHVPEPATAECWDGGGPSMLVGTLRDGRSVFAEWTCGDAIERTTATFASGSIHLEPDTIPLQGLPEGEYDDTAVGEGDGEE